MLLITEEIKDVSYTTQLDEATGKKTLFLEGIFLQANVKNRNGRIYPVNVMEKEANRYIKETVKQNRAYGELGHPQGAAINLDRVSHIITELRRDGDNYIGKAKVTSTPMGEIARGLLEAGANLGVSSRGLGTLKPIDGGIMEVQDDFHIASAADIVADPSAPNAFVKGILEGVQWIYDPVKGTWMEECTDNVRRAVKRMRMDEVERQKLSIMETYIRGLTSLK